MNFKIILLVLVLGVVLLTGCTPAGIELQRTKFQGDFIVATGSSLVEDADGSVTIYFKNNLNHDIMLPLTGEITARVGTDCTGDGTVTATYQLPDDAYIDVSRASRIPSQGTFAVRWDCHPTKDHALGESFKAEVSFEYVTTNNGVTSTQTGTFVGEYE